MQDIKQKPKTHLEYKISTNENDPVLLNYKLTAQKRESKRNMVIAMLVSGILFFLAGFVAADVKNNEVKALTNTNASLRVENAELKLQTAENQ